MAARSRGGYNCQFAEEPPKGLRCVICQAVARQPQQHGECGKLFCNSCITQHTLNSNKCPNCELQLHTFYDGKSDQEIKALKVGCVSADDGCQWTGALGLLDQHLKLCEYGSVACPNSCILNKEVVMVPCKSLQNHLENECVRRQYICPHCEEPGVYTERITLHLEICPKVKVRCPNIECPCEIPRTEVEKHKAECEYEMATCKFAKFGCTEKMAKIFLRAHEEDDHQHLQSTKEKVLELTKLIEEQDKSFRAQIQQQDKEITSIRQILGGCRRYTTPIYYKFSRFTEHKQNNKVIYSPPFYSSQDGYRMVISLWPNGNGTGRNTHISMYAFLEKGDNDASLSWPFRGSVEVTLINQLDDKNHLTFSIEFSESQESSGRVVDRERSDGWGKPRLLAHHQLVYNPKKMTQYLRNDSIYFKLDVKVPDHKPWLACTV